MSEHYLYNVWVDYGTTHSAHIGIFDDAQEASNLVLAIEKELMTPGSMFIRIPILPGGALHTYRKDTVYAVRTELELIEIGEDDDDDDDGNDDEEDEPSGPDPEPMTAEDFEVAFSASVK